MYTVLQRYALSTTAATFITGALVLIMHYAIHADDVPIDDPEPTPVLSFLPEIVEPPLTLRPPIPPKPEPPQPPPEAEVPKFVPVSTGGGIPGPTPPPTGPGVTPSPGAAEGDLLPIMTVPPEYPERMASRGTEGWVIVEFSVDELGRVVAPRVVESYPSRGFDKAALRAVLRYKYKPRVINGSAVPVHGVRQRIVFNMSKA